jgi:putative hydrolase of the HAD superfamily
LFVAVEVPSEKTAAMYRELATRHGCDAVNTWMIGNSPRSDINPALAAGLGAIFIPHDFTWVLEHEVVEFPRDPDRLLELKGFRDLLQYF